MTQDKKGGAVSFAPITGLKAEEMKKAGNDKTGGDKAPAGAAKFWIMSLDDNKLAVSAQFNPKELSIDRSVPWSPPGEASKSNSSKPAPKGVPGGIDLEFTGAQGRTLTVELLFDEAEKNVGDAYKPQLGLAKSVTTLEAMASVQEPGNKKDENKRRPHHCVCAWGSSLRSSEGNKFKCVINKVTTKYTLFDRAGNPLRASVTLTLQEADNVSTKKDDKKGGK